ncbi:MAG TPA: AMP-binding protein, partial [Woeseiaceae bacterium]|nr:AMP-binding protein [Woeseiaceae bacterium]
MPGFAIFDVLERRADLGPERVAMHDLAAGRALTYLEMHQRAGRSAALLADLGIAAGDRVALLCRNRIEFFEILFACARIEAILVPLNWRMPPAELEKLLADCGARCLLYGKEDAHSASALGGASLRRLGLDDDGDDGFAARRDALSAVARAPARQADDTWYLLYTSGTTGRPKAVINTFGMAMANYVNISQGMELSGDDTTLCFLPLFHSGGINLTAL